MNSNQQEGTESTQEHRLNPFEKLVVKVYARQPFSKDCLIVKTGEKYTFEVSPTDFWQDWFIKTNANGFCNILLKVKDKRVPSANCFTLCGTFGENEENHFPIGTSLKWAAFEDGQLHFFANDSKKLDKKEEFKYYKNNKGAISLTIHRTS